MERVSIVAGASSGIGRAVAQRLAERGMHVHCWGRQDDELARTAQLCRDGSGRPEAASARVVDVDDTGALAEAVEAVAANGRLAAVVWCVGLFDYASAEAADPVTWSRLIGTNLSGAAVLTALVSPLLVEAAQAPRVTAPALVYVGSAAGHQAFPANAAYVASKHGLTGLARATFLDLRGHGVKVSLVSPGLVASGAGLRSPLGRRDPGLLLDVADVANAVAYVLDHPDRGCPTEIRLQPFADS